MRKIAVPLAAFGLVAVVTLAALEIVLRTVYSLEEITAPVWFVPWINKVSYEQRFLEEYRGRDLDTVAHDPLLGWDYNMHNNRIRPPNAPAPGKAADGYRVLAIGDSFAHGNEVAQDEVFTHVLNRMIRNAEAFTMGAGGYGIDQAALKYMEHGRRFEPDVVIFLIHPPDYVRAGLPFFSFSKPLIEVDPEAPDGYVLRNVPVPHPQAELDRIARESFWKSRLLYFVAARLSLFPLLRDGLIERYVEEVNPRVHKALDLVRTEVESRGGVLMIAEVPYGGAYARFSGRTNYRAALAAMYPEFDPEWIDLLTRWSSAYPSDVIERRLYVNRENGVLGHLSVQGNAQLALELAERLCAPDAAIPLNCDYAAAPAPLGAPRSEPAGDAVGAFRPATPDTGFMVEGGIVRVETEARAPIYGALAEITLPEGAEYASLTVTLRVTEGVAQIGVLSRDRSRFLALERMPASGETVEWRSPSLAVADLGPLMIGNDRTSPGRSVIEVLLTGATYRVEP